MTIRKYFPTKKMLIGPKKLTKKNTEKQGTGNRENREYSVAKKKQLRILN